MNLCENIYRLRSERAMTQDELAELLDVSRQSVSKWETGTSIPELDKLMKMCDIFGVSLDVLTGRAESARPMPAGSIPTPTSTAAAPARRRTRPLGIIFLLASLLLIAAAILCAIFAKPLIGLNPLICALLFPSLSLALAGAVVCFTVKSDAAVWIAIALGAAMIASLVIAASIFILQTVASSTAHITIETHSISTVEIEDAD